MPTLTRWFVKSALIYLVLALLVGVVAAGQAVVDLGPLAGALTAVYVHLFMVGFVTQAIFGVAYWMFPRHSKERPRGSESLALATYLTLNVGLICRAIAEPMISVQPVLAWREVLVAGTVLQWLAAVAFAANTWSRVKER